MVMDLKFDDDVCINIDLPSALRRQLALRSLERGMDLQSLILEVIQNECSGKECDF